MTGVAGPTLEWIMLIGLDQPRAISDMGIVTFDAIQAFSRNVQMGGQEFLVTTVMTVQANLRNRAHQKGGVIRAVGIVARQTFTVFHRFMHLALGQAFGQVLMAGKAKIRGLFSQQDLQLPSVGQMAGGTGSSHERGVPAAAGGNLGIQIVATQTQLTFGLVEHARLLGTVRLMAQAAIVLGHGLMRNFGRALGPDLFVATETQSRPRFFQQGWIIRLVGSMAIQALAQNHRLVGVRQTQPLIGLAMAVTAQRLGIPLDKARLVGSVGSVAFQTFPVGKRRVAGSRGIRHGGIQMATLT